MIKIVVAMEREAQSLRDAGCNRPIHICGIGATDLPADLTSEDTILNIGYAGSLALKVGTICIPTGVYDKRNDWFNTLKKEVGNDSALCVTEEKFVEGGDGNRYPANTVFDMELARIAELPHKHLVSFKIVSDNCNEKDCEAFNDAECWKKAWQQFLLWRAQNSIKW